MTQKRKTPLKEWAENVSSEWKHIPSMKGKQAEINLFILRSLFVSPIGRMSVWDLALKYLKESEEKFGFWDDNKIYRERMKINARINRRINVLCNHEYVNKNGSLYQLTSKGWFFMFSLDTTLINSVTEKTNQPQFDLEDSIAMKFEQGVGKDFGFQFSDSSVVWLKKMLIDPASSKAIATFLRETFKQWKSNFDEISNAEFINLFETKIASIVKKALKR